jgi:hypothetical protein
MAEAQERYHNYILRKLKEERKDDGVQSIKQIAK